MCIWDAHSCGVIVQTETNNYIFKTSNRLQCGLYGLSCDLDTEASHQSDKTIINRTFQAEDCCDWL